MQGDLPPAVKPHCCPQDRRRRLPGSDEKNTCRPAGGVRERLTRQGGFRYDAAVGARRRRRSAARCGTARSDRLASESGGARCCFKRQLSFRKGRMLNAGSATRGPDALLPYLADESATDSAVCRSGARNVPQAEIDVRDRDEDDSGAMSGRNSSMTRRIGRLAIVPSWEVAAHEPADDEITLHPRAGTGLRDRWPRASRLCMLLLERLLTRFRYRVDCLRLADRPERPSGIPSAAPVRRHADCARAQQPAEPADLRCRLRLRCAGDHRAAPVPRGLRGRHRCRSEAIEVTLENAVRNQVESRLRCDTTPLAQGPRALCRRAGQPDRPTLIELAAELAAHVDLGGVLIVAGILESQVQTVQAAFLAQGLVETTRATEGEWASLEYLRCRGGGEHRPPLRPAHRRRRRPRATHRSMHINPPSKLRCDYLCSTCGYRGSVEYNDPDAIAEPEPIPGNSRLLAEQAFRAAEVALEKKRSAAWACCAVRAVRTVTAS